MDGAKAISNLVGLVWYRVMFLRQTKVNALAELLPWNWKAARAAQDVKVAA
jgi:hypothetical protein